MKNHTHGSALFTDTESFLSELSIHEESLLSGGCGNSGNNRSRKSNKNRSRKSGSGCGFKLPPVTTPPVTTTPVAIGSGYGT